VSEPTTLYEYELPEFGELWGGYVELAVNDGDIELRALAWRGYEDRHPITLPDIEVVKLAAALNAYLAQQGASE
jgi:hypothetical protein